MISWKWSAAAAAAAMAVGLVAGVTIGPAITAKPQPAAAVVAQARTESATVDNIEQIGDTGRAYVDMPTPGPTVTVNVGPSRRVLVILSAHLSGRHPGAMSVEVSGASAIRASDVRGLTPRLDGGTGSFTILLTAADGLREGPNVFAAKYRSVESGDHALVAGARNITVIPL
ncbi:hypothetical protein AB0C02_30375 [Micromonospora sp. NPDC048999]|uniref:hypothetical protein n=1 Tax=Micromonospora sp. NPDC048999 TaxID=3155391 RepID=UPI0034040FF2